MVRAYDAFLQIYQPILDILMLINKKKQLKIWKYFSDLTENNEFSPKYKWKLNLDKISTEQDRSLHVAHYIQIVPLRINLQGYVISIKHMGKFLVSLGDKVSPTDMEEGKRICVDKNKYQVQVILPSKADSQVLSMVLEEKPDIVYGDVGGCKEQIIKIREIVEYPLLYPRRFSLLGIDPPRGAMLFGPPGTGKTLIARAVANRTNACFMRVICSELVQRYIGEGARLVRELFQFCKKKNACIIFFDELDAIGGTRFENGMGGDNEVHRTMLELVNQLDGFDVRGNTKVLMATNRPDTIDPALMRPGRLDRKIEFGLPDFEGRIKILKIHSKKIKYDLKLRFELIARLCVNSTGADIRSICTEAGMFAIRKQRICVKEKDFLDAINKIIKSYSKFNPTFKYLNYN